MYNYILQGDSIKTLKGISSGSVNCCVTSPPYYGLRDYFIDGQIGHENTPEEYIHKLVAVFNEVKRILRDDGTLWVNIGDSYAGSGKGGSIKDSMQKTSNKASCLGNVYDIEVDTIERNKKINVAKNTFEGIKAKDLIGIPWMLAFALRANGWYLRQDIIWHKPNPMPESVKDRCTKSHEYIFLLSKSAKYYFDEQSIKEPSIYAGDDRGSRGDSRRGTECNSMSGVTGDYRNKRDVWVVQTEPSPENHFAMFPQKLILPCILCGCPENGIVLDPFMGAGTTAVVAIKNQRRYIGCEINPEYVNIAEKRIVSEKGLFND